MSLILLLETYNNNCSVGISQNGQLIYSVINTDGKSHSAILTGLIDESLRKTGLTVRQLDAVAVSKGPGSYTGLRIGVSTAKGICYGADRPLLAPDTLQYLAKAVSSATLQDNDHFFCPMIDARRLEVYCAVYDASNRVVSPPEAVIISENSFSEYSGNKKLVFFGDGAEKCKKVLSGNPNLIYINIEEYHVLSSMALTAHELYMNQRFENTAYFEPFYLKDFVAAAPKVKGLT